MQGLWLGVTLTLWGAVLFTHGKFDLLDFTVAVFTLIGGVIVVSSEMPS
jgi:hypothetical protein